MIDGNISMEEDTELRDLIVQTLENNGALAKVRAELRASVFLTLEEQGSVLNPEPFLKKKVKQYLANSEGKLLFSLVREFLEYFGLDYSISVYDAETYFGKEYNYAGRKKLCEELGITSKEPLLGEILKSTINSALNNSNKSNSSNIKLDRTNECSGNLANATFDISIPKVLQKDSASISTDSNSETPIDAKISNENVLSLENKVSNISVNESLHEETKNNRNAQLLREEKFPLQNSNTESNNLTKEKESKMDHNKLISTQSDVHQNKETYKNKALSEFQTVNNVKNKKQSEPISNSGKTVFFDEIIKDGVKESIAGNQNNELFLGQLPPLPSTNNSVFGDLPPLLDKKANMNDLKELMDIAQGISQSEENFTTFVPDNGNEQVQTTSTSPLNKLNKQESVQNTQSENESEEICEEISTSISGLERVIEKSMESLTTTNHVE